MADDKEPVDPKTDADLHKRALKHADEAWGQEFDNVDSGRDCQRFYAGGMAQWDPEAAQRRKDANRPVLTMNRIPAFVKQLTGEVRQNPPSIKVLPAKDGATQDKAEIFNGLIRNIEQQSLAKAAYTKATENAAIAGQGHWRVITEYSSDDSFDQDIRIKRINDPFAVLIDPLAQMPDKSDMRYAFIFEDIAKEDYRRRYPKATSLESWPSNVADQGLAWRTVDTVKIAEYWYKAEVTKTLEEREDGSTGYAEDPLKEGEVRSPSVKTRKVKVWQVRSCIMSGKDVLEGPFDWPGRYIPICTVVGEEIAFDGRVIRKGMVHDARDPQKVYNTMRSAAVEAVSSQPRSPYIGTIEQFKGLESTWANANANNSIFLPYNHDARTPGPPQRSPPPIASQGLDVQSQIAVGDLEGTTGIFKAGLGQQGNETSGRAIIARQKEGDTGTFHFIDNLGIAINYCGRILVDLIPKIYDSTRVVRTLGEDDSAQMVQINEPAKDAAGQQVTLNDLSTGEYDVVVTTGPSYATKRAESSEFMTELARGFPQMVAVAGDLMVKNMDVPGADEIAKRLQNAMGIGEDGEPIQQEQQPNPKEAADAIKAAADADKTIAETQGIEIENRAKLLELSTGMQAFGQTLQGIEALLQQIAGQGSAQPQPGAPPEQPMPMEPPPAPPPMDAQPMQSEGEFPPMVELEEVSPQ